MFISRHALRIRVVFAVSCFVVCLAASVPAGTAFALEAQSASPGGGVAAATAKLVAGDPAAAAKMLEGVTAAEPKNAEAWRLLGIARRQLGALDPALAAFGKALDLEPDSGRVMFGIGDTWALKGNADEAFKWLGRAKATRTIDMTQAEVDPSLSRLKKDPRFAKLLPTPADFDHPFVEPVKIVREWDGEGANDQFGWIARNIGDVDGDGVNDVVTSAPGVKTDGPNAGRVYVYSTKSGRLLWTADGHAGDRLGTGIEAAGDTNGDGVPDVVAGAPGADKAYVYSGRDGRVLLTLAGEAKGDGFGSHTDGVGDVNHDGHADVIVGAPRSNAGGQGGRAGVRLLGEGRAPGADAHRRAGRRRLRQRRRRRRRRPASLPDGRRPRRRRRASRARLCVRLGCRRSRRS